MDDSEVIRVIPLPVSGSCLLRKKGFAARSVFRSFNTIVISLKLFLGFPDALRCIMWCAWCSLLRVKGRRKSPLLTLIPFCYWHQNSFSLKLTFVCWRNPYYFCAAVGNSISKSRAIRPAFSLFWTLKSMGDNCLMLLSTWVRRTTFKYLLGFRAQELFARRSPFGFAQMVWVTKLVYDIRFSPTTIHLSALTMW